MSTSLLWVTLLTALISSVTSGTLPDPVPDANQQRGSSLRFVFAFFRHGIRAPLHQPYPKDPNASQYHNYFPLPGQLTETGMKMMYEVGKKLKHLYGDFLGDYREDKAYVTSTDMTRTIMTAQTVMAGLFPPPKTIFEELGNWQPVPVWQGSKDFDKAYIFNDVNMPAQGLKDCPKYGELIDKGWNKIIQKDETQGRRKLYKLIQQHTGKNDVNSIETMYEVFDTLQFESLNGLPLPTWATKQQPKFQNKPLYPDLTAPLMKEWFIDAEYLDNDKEMLSFFSGPLFYTIQEHFQQILKEPLSPRRFRFHATHDTALFVFLWALGLTDPYTVGPGDGILFELHTVKKEPIVKVFYFDSNNKYNVRELILPTCPFPCSLTNFSVAAPAISPQQWEQKCKE